MFGIIISQEKGIAISILNAFYVGPFFFIHVQEKTSTATTNYLSVRKQVNNVYRLISEVTSSVIATEVYRELSSNIVWSYSLRQSAITFNYELLGIKLHADYNLPLDTVKLTLSGMLNCGTYLRVTAKLIILGCPSSDSNSGSISIYSRSNEN